MLVTGCSAFGVGKDDEPPPAPAPPVAEDAGSAGDSGDATDGGAHDAGTAVFNVPCGQGTACTAVDQVCCDYACGAASTCASSTVFQCNDAEDCAAAGKPGAVCCMNRTNSVVNSTACREICGSDEARACNLGRGDEQCENGKHCLNELSTNGYGICL